MAADGGAGAVLTGVLALAAATLTGFIRDRGVCAGALAIAAAFGLGMAVSGATVDAGPRLAANLGWFAAGLVGWVLAIGYGSGLVDRGGVVGPLALAAPVGTGAVVVGRHLGLLAGLALYCGLTTVPLAVALGTPAAGAGWLLFLRLMVVLSMALLLGSLFRPGSAALLAVPTAMAGWLSPAELPGPVAAAGRMLLPRLGWLAPPLDGGPDLLGPTLYAALYSGALLLLAALAAGSVARRRGEPL